MGQAVGAVAACAAKAGIKDSAKVPKADWKQAIEKQGGIVPEKGEASLQDANS
jgi:hypothetical protein